MFLEYLEQADSKNKKKGDWFKTGDLLILGNTPDEVVEVTSVSGTTVNIKRGLLGTTPSVITNNEEINYFFVK